MEINQALEDDNATGSQALLELDAIATQLQTFKTRYPSTFNYLCGDGRRTCEMSLGDAISAVNEALDALEES